MTKRDLDKDGDFIARYDKLADAFYAETGVWPPGRSLPLEMGWVGISDDECWECWTTWCARRAMNQPRSRDVTCEDNPSDANQKPNVDDCVDRPQKEEEAEGELK